MHKYLRAIGFTEQINKKKIREILENVVLNSDESAYSLSSEGEMMGVFCKNFAPNIGIAVCGTLDNDKSFTYDYYFPYLRGKEISSSEDITVERHAEKESYAGICDDFKVGVTLIFYLQNVIPYLKAQNSKKLPINGTTLTLTALSISGMIMMPIRKNEKQQRKVAKETANRQNLLAAAKRGDEDAIETLTLEDMDTYTAISRRIQREDVFSLVDTYFMPYGVECDHYSVLGEILKVERVTNQMTGETVCLLKICSNEIVMDVAINERDLYGEPQEGRRFKGEIWLQGYINYPGDADTGS